MDKATITAVREVIKGDALTDSVKANLDKIESYYDDTVEIKSKNETLQKDNENLQIKYMALKGRLEKAEVVIEDLKELGTDNDKAKKDLEKLQAENETLKSENESLKIDKVEQDNAKRKAYVERLEKVKDLPAFENVKDEVIVPSDEKKVEDLTLEEIKDSMKALDLAEKHGVFGEIDSRIKSGNPPNTAVASELEKTNKVRKAMKLPLLEK